MRFQSLELSGFRGFANHQTFDLDADVVVVVGANGNGKTSLFDALLWALSGSVSRLKGGASSIVSKYSSTGEARVILRLVNSGGLSPITITRSSDGLAPRVSVETPDGIVHGPGAEDRMIQLIWREAATAEAPGEALTAALTRSVYLQQDRVRDFIDAATDQERFKAVSELVGVGRVTELQLELQRTKQLWTTMTTSKSEETKPLRLRLSQLGVRLNSFKARRVPGEDKPDEESWNRWWAKLLAMGVKVSAVPMASLEAATAIDIAIRQIDALRRAAERRQQQLDSLESEIRVVSQRSKPDAAAPRKKVEVLKKQVQEARLKVSGEQTRVAEFRRLQANLKERSEQLQALATLALKHLGNKCPVCDQEYDLELTRRRLQSIVMSSSSVRQDSVPTDTLPMLLATLASLEKDLSTAELELRTIDQAAKETEVAELTIEQRFEELGLQRSSTTDRSSYVHRAAAATVKRIEELVLAQQTGERFALLLSQAGEQAVIQELERQILADQLELQRQDNEIAERNATGELAQKVIGALREAASQVVAKQVGEIEPLLREIYSRIDVHPAFRDVRFLQSFLRGRGQLSTAVNDSLTGIEIATPGEVLSSSQMNALAVSVFLSLNLGVSKPPLEAVILDDPLQSLDDINLLGLIDLLRRAKDQRQLCISTHDADFGELLARKLRPRTPEQRTIVIKLDSWSRTGPSVTARMVKCDPSPFRLAASQASQ